MSQAALVLALLGPPSEEQQAAISAYEHTRHVRLERVAPVAGDGKKPTYSGYDAKVVAELEAELDAARTSAASLDEARAVELLANFEKKLFAHPELPQSAWLLAERHRLGAEIAASKSAAVDARDHLRRALVLEGPRAAEFGAAKAADEQTLPEATPMRVDGLEARDLLEIDGRAIEGRTPALAAGQHHVRVVRSGRLVYAGWVTLGEGASALRLMVPPVAACSAEDFSGYRALSTRAVAAPGTRCPRWVLAAPAARGLRFADCFADHCGPFVSISGEVKRVSLPPQPEREPPSRTLITAAVVGAVLVVGTAAALWQSGAFDEEKPGQTIWVYGGVSPAR